MGMPFVGLAIFAALIGIAVWLFVRASRANELRRAELRARVSCRQPWESHDSNRGGNH